MSWTLDGLSHPGAPQVWFYISGQHVPASAESRGTLRLCIYQRKVVGLAPASSESSISRHSPAFSQSLAFYLQDWVGGITAEALFELDLYGK